MGAEKVKSVVGLKPKKDMVDIYDQDHANEYEDRRKPYIMEQHEDIISLDGEFSNANL